MTGWPPQICAPDPQGAADAQLAAKAAVLANVLADFPALRPTNVPWAWWRATTLPGAGRRL